MKKFIATILIMLFLTGCSVASAHDKKQFEDCVSICLGSEEFLPAIEDIIKDDKFSYTFYQDISALGGCGIVVSEKIEQGHFFDRQEEVLELYDYLNEPVYEQDGKTPLIPQVEFNIDNYTFRVLSEHSKGYSYPKNIGIIATSEADSRILYFAYYNQDLDYIEDMVKFVKTHFPRWNR